MADSPVVPIILGGGLLLALLLGRRAAAAEEGPACPPEGCDLGDLRGFPIGPALNQWREALIAEHRSSGIPILDPFWDSRRSPKPLANVNFTREEVPDGSREYQRVVNAWLNAVSFFARQEVDLSKNPIEILRSYGPEGTRQGVMLLNEALRTSWSDTFEFYDSGEWG